MGISDKPDGGKPAEKLASMQFRPAIGKGKARRSF
jgi:hypothetical protein